MIKKTVQEDETKNILKVKYFSEYNWTRVIGKIDLTVSSQPKLGVLPTNFLWAETKQGKKKDIYESFIQLILTIGKGPIPDVLGYRFIWILTPIILLYAWIPPAFECG